MKVRNICIRVRQKAGNLQIIYEFRIKYFFIFRTVMQSVIIIYT